MSTYINQDLSPNGAPQFARAGFGVASDSRYMVYVTQPALDGVAPVFMIWTSGAHTNMTASTEAPSLSYNFSATKQWATGALTQNREVIIQNPTYGFVGSSTVTQAILVDFRGAPQAGTNAIFTASTNLRLASHSQHGTFRQANLLVEPVGIATSITAVTTLADCILSSSMSNTVLGDQTATLTNLNRLRIEAPTYESTTNVRTVTNPVSLYIQSGPVASTNVTFTNPSKAIYVEGGISHFGGAIYQSQGVDIASTADITLGTDGNVFEVTGTTTIDHISNSGVPNGRMVTLVFNASCTVNHNTATSGSNVKILLSGAANFAATANDTLTLVLSENTVDGIAWREICRTVI